MLLGSLIDDSIIKLFTVHQPSDIKTSPTAVALVDDSVVPIMDIGEMLGSGPIGISIGIRYRVPTP